MQGCGCSSAWIVSLWCNVKEFSKCPNKANVVLYLDYISFVVSFPSSRNNCPPKKSGIVAFGSIQIGLFALNCCCCIHVKESGSCDDSL